MTHHEINLIPAGRDADAAVAVALFGCQWMRERRRNIATLVAPPGGPMIVWNYDPDDFDPAPPDCPRFPNWWNSVGWPAPGGGFGPYVSALPKFSTDTGAAWLVVEWLRGKGRAVKLKGLPTEWVVNVQRPDGLEVWGCAADMPLALCRAALSAALPGDPPGGAE